MGKVLGVDCSTNSFAFALFNGEKLEKWGEVSFGKGDIFHRMNNANRVVSTMLDSGFFDDVDTVIFESATYIQNKQTVILLAYAFGAALSPLFKPGVTVTSVNPITWQNFIGNKAFTKAEKDAVKKAHPDKKASWHKEELRKERKERTRRWVSEQFKVKIDSDNITDAVGVGWYGVKNG